MPISFSKRWTDMFGIFSLGRGVHDPYSQECSWEHSQSRPQLFFWILYNPYFLIIRNEIGTIGNVTSTVTGKKGPCLNHSLRDGRTCSILCLPVRGDMTLITSNLTGNLTGKLTDSSLGCRIVLSSRTSVR